VQKRWLSWDRYISAVELPDWCGHGAGEVFFQRIKSPAGLGFPIFYPFFAVVGPLALIIAGRISAALALSLRVLRFCCWPV
jgi:hypothetical protein